MGSSNFGELVLESSRAFADDEDESIIALENSYGLDAEYTQEGSKYLADLKQQEEEEEEGSVSRPRHVLVAFVGKVAVGFSKGYVGKGDSSDFKLFGQICLTGNDSAVDLCSSRPRRQPIVQIYINQTAGSPDSAVIFALIDFKGVPRFLANDMVQKMSALLGKSSEVVIFHSETNAYNVSDIKLEGKTVFLTSTYFPRRLVPKGVKPMRPPNMISGPSASILTHCQMIRKPCLLFATYCETEVVDSISLKPFFQAVSCSESRKVEMQAEKPNNNEGNEKEASSQEFNLARVFSQFKHNIDRSVKSNINAVVDSNLYI